MRRKEKISLVLILATFLLMSTAYVGFAHGADKTSKTRTIAAFGEDARTLASAIATRTNLIVVTRIDDGCMVAVISDMKNVEVSAVVGALQNKAVIIAVNLPPGNELISSPTLDQKDVKTEYTIDLEQNKVVSEYIVGETTTTLHPAYWVSVIQYDGILTLDSYALMIDSPQKRQELFLGIAARVGDATKITMNSVQGVISPLTDFPAPTSDWKKRAERSYLWDLGSGNQLKTRYEMFSLRCWDEVTQQEYWRTDAYIDHYLPTYVQNTGHCGPWMNMRQMVVAASSGTDIYDYSPHTTASDTGASVNIGFSVSSKGVDVGVGYSWSWTNPGVRYDVGADYVNSKITWNETFRGPDYFWYPWYSGPTEAAHNSYNAKTTVIMRTPLGNGLYISSLKSMWQKYDDTLTFLLFVLKVDRLITTYTDTFSVGQLGSIFKCIIKIQSWPTTDYYSRSHGLAVDKDLPEGWWNLQGYQFLVTSQSFTYTRTVYILPGSHFVEYAASGYVPNYAWHAKIYINDVFIIEGDVGRVSANHLRASFTTWWVT